MAATNNGESAREYKLHGSVEFSDTCVMEHELIDALRALDFIRNELRRAEAEQDQFAIEMNWIGAIVKFSRCFEKGSAKKFRLQRAIFSDGFENGTEAFDFIKNHRDKAIIHDESPYIQSQTVVVPSPDDASFGVGYFMMNSCIDKDHITCLGRLCEIALKKTRVEKDALESQIRESVDRLGGIEWVNKQPIARLVVPGAGALAESRKDWTPSAAVKSRREKP